MEGICMTKNYYQDLISNSEVDPIDFDSLDVSLHQEPDQIRRRLSAKKIKDENITDCGDYYSIIGSSGDVYHTSSNICSCFDFANRNLPCKHIYRFALDHGQIEDFPKVDSKMSKQFANIIDSEVERFDAYYKQGLISAEKYLKIIDAIRKGK